MTGKEQTQHIIPLGVYMSIGVGLIIMTAITVLVAQYDLGAANLFVAMAIAGIKATLVALVFMHLKYDNKLFAAVFVGALLFLAAFITFTMFDTMARGAIDESKAAPFDNQVEYIMPGQSGNHSGVVGDTADQAVQASDSISTDTTAKTENDH